MRWTVTFEGKVEEDDSRARTETLKLLERREEMTEGPMLPDAPMMMTFLMDEDMM